MKWADRLVTGQQPVDREIGNLERGASECKVVEEEAGISLVVKQPFVLILGQGLVVELLGGQAGFGELGTIDVRKGQGHYPFISGGVHKQGVCEDVIIVVLFLSVIRERMELVERADVDRYGTVQIPKSILDVNGIDIPSELNVIRHDCLIEVLIGRVAAVGLQIGGVIFSVQVVEAGK